MKIVLDAEWVQSPEGKPIYWTDKIHCIVCKEVDTSNWFEFYGDSLKEFNSFLQGTSTLIAHNLICADLHVFQRVLNIPFTVSPKNTIQGREVEFIDTLDWSRRLFPDRPVPRGHKGAHGLDPWGTKIGVPKPKIQDWENLDIKHYLHRCREDVKINELVYYKLLEEQQ